MNLSIRFEFGSGILQLSHPSRAICNVCNNGMKCCCIRWWIRILRRQRSLNSSRHSGYFFNTNSGFLACAARIKSIPPFRCVGNVKLLTTEKTKRLFWRKIDLWGSFVSIIKITAHLTLCIAPVPKKKLFGKVLNPEKARIRLNIIWLVD